MRRSKIYTKELLEDAVKNCLNFTQVCKYLGKFPKGATYQLIQSRIIDYGIDTSHFLGKRTNCGERHNGSCKKKHWSERLINGYVYRPKSKILRRALIESGREYKCNSCGLFNIWNSKEITLHIHHKDGNWSDSRKENLEFLCPNCHSQEHN